MSVNEANPSELDLLRQRISELESKNAKLEAELEKKNVELEERRLSVDHLMKQINELRNSNIKRDAENAELKVRVAKLEQGSSAVDVQSQDVLSEVETFLIKEHKKSVSEEIRQRNEEKKLQCELTAQETPGPSALSIPSRTPLVLKILLP